MYFPDLLRFIAFGLALEVLAMLPFLVWLRARKVGVAPHAWWLVAGLEIILVSCVARILLHTGEPTTFSRAPLVIIGTSLLNVYLGLVLRDWARARRKRV